jgi:hypothetical protein
MSADRFDLPELPDAMLNLRFGYDHKQMREYGQACRAALLAELDALRADAANLRGFAHAVMGTWPDVGGLDGFDLQELGVKFGLLEKKDRIAPCREETCNCAEYETGPVECFVLTSLAAMAAEKGAL